MTNTIKVIDLLNKIANGEEVPEKIKYENNCYLFKHTNYSIDHLYELIEGYDKTYIGWLEHKDIFLFDTVEIIEEQEEIDIQSIEEIEPAMNGNAYVIDNKTWTLNQVIKAVKQLDKKIKEK